MATLYELKGQWKALYDMMDDCEDDGDLILDTLEGIDGEIEAKADGYACVLTQLDADDDAISKEIERLQKRRMAVRNNKERIKTRLQDAMELTGKYKFKTERFSFNLQNNPPKVVIDKPESVPQEFLIPQEPKVDSRAVKEYLKNFGASWGHLEQGKSVRIR